MSDKIKLDIISDVVCPWCIIGYKHLSAAIEELELQQKIEIYWHPFELNPDMPAEGEELTAHVARKYGSSKADSERARLNITEAGARYGFTFNYYDGMRMVNTFDAHVLLDYSEQLGKQTELKMRLFSAFFSEGKDISNRDILLSEANTIGISSKQATIALQNNEIKQRVKKLESQWQQMGINGVPTVIFNNTSMLTGAYPKETFIKVLQEILDSGADN